MPIISVVIPTYNRPSKLETAVKSVLSQTFSDFEILVINDSDEETPVKNVISKINDNRIHYLKNRRRKGGNGARNTGIVNARGKYIALLDDDDEWFPDKLTEQINKLQMLDATWGGCYCGYLLLDNNKWLKKLNLYEGEVQKEYLLAKFSIGASSTLFIKKSVFEVTGLFDEDLEKTQDNHYVTVFLRSFKLAFVNKLLVKINGHNPDASAIERSRLMYYKKIDSDIAKLSKTEIKIFYDKQYLMLAEVFAAEGNINKSLYYLIKSMKYKIHSPVKYLTTMLISFDYKTGWNICHLIKLLKDKMR